MQPNATLNNNDKSVKEIKELSDGEAWFYWQHIGDFLLTWVWTNAPFCFYLNMVPAAVTLLLEMETF